MNSVRKTAVTTGVLLIVATAAALVASSIQPAIEGSDYLAGVASHPLRLAASGLGTLLAAATSVGIAIALYPLLKRTHPALAIGAVVFRTIEAAFYALGAVSLLAIGSVAKAVADGPPSSATASQSVADALGSLHDHAASVAVFAFCIGGFLYYVALWRARLLPRWLSGWGVLAAASMWTAVLLSIFLDKPITSYVALAAPILFQEIVMAVWLLVKGFRETTAAGVAGA
ncbi:MAG: DUF4386 domain-containing protein [Demequinaceae bacterium]|nr:DUF4386 domain-containing protein [Demequinaceae bacterium]